MERCSFITKLALIVLCVLFAGCTEDIPDKFTEGDIPPPPSLKIVSSSVRDDLEIRSDQPITITFSNVMDSVNIDITGVNGNTNLDYSNTSATFKPFSTIPDGVYTLRLTGKDKYDQDIQETITVIVKNGENGGNGGNPLPSSSMIVYTSDIDGDYEIYMMKADGTEIKQLTNNFAQDIQPIWSPDGKFIAFSSNRDDNILFCSDIIIMRADGSAQNNITNTWGVNEYNAIWSLDSKKIAFLSDFDGKWYVINIDGTNWRPWNSNDNLNDYAYPWVFNDNELKEDLSSGNYEIYLNPHGSGNWTNLTNNWANDRYPSWSYDGNYIVFSSDRDLGNFISEIYIMDANGSNQRRLTYNSADDSQPCWSPF
jgi:TolB protein